MLCARWPGPRRLTERLEVFEPRPGGGYWYVQTDVDGSLHAIHGVDHEVSAPVRVFRTFEYKGLPEYGHGVLAATSFDALPGGRTRVTIRSAFLSVEDRDGMLHSGKEEGVGKMDERLDELLRELA